jgi:hypothetical protein
MCCAAFIGHVDAVTFFVEEMKVPIDLPCPISHKCALQHAVDSNQIGVVTYLLSKNAKYDSSMLIYCRDEMKELFHPYTVSETDDDVCTMKLEKKYKKFKLYQSDKHICTLYLN